MASDGLAPVVRRWRPARITTRSSRSWTTTRTGADLSAGACASHLEGQALGLAGVSPVLARVIVDDSGGSGELVGAWAPHPSCGKLQG
jgi:hypothetical protein